MNKKTFATDKKASYVFQSGSFK